MYNNYFGKRGISTKDDIRSWVEKLAKNFTDDITKSQAQKDFHEFLKLYHEAKIHHLTYEDASIPESTNTVGDFLKFLEEKKIDPKKIDSAILELYSKFETKSRMLLICAPRVEFVGDIHGNYKSLIKRLEKWNGETTLLFTGDYGDNDRVTELPDDSIAVYLYLFALKLLLPEKIHLLRGNHESSSIAKDSEYGKKWVYQIDDQCFNLLERIWQETMPLTACVFPGGGLSKSIPVYVKHSRSFYSCTNSFTELHGANVNPKDDKSVDSFVGFRISKVGSNFDGFLKIGYGFAITGHDHGRAGLVAYRRVLINTLSDDGICNGGKFDPYVTVEGIFAQCQSDCVAIRRSNDSTIPESQTLLNLRVICDSLNQTKSIDNSKYYSTVSSNIYNSGIGLDMNRHRHTAVKQPFENFCGYAISDTGMYIAKTPDESDFSQLLKNVKMLKITTVVVHIFDEKDKIKDLFKGTNLKLFTIYVQKPSAWNHSYLFADYSDKERKINSVREIAKLSRNGEQILFCCNKGNCFSILSCILVRMVMQFEYTIKTCTTQAFATRYYDELKHIFKHVDDFYLSLSQIIDSMKNMMLIFNISSTPGELMFCDEGFESIESNASKDVSQEFLSSLVNTEITHVYNQRRNPYPCFWDNALVKMLWNKDRKPSDPSPMGCLSFTINKQ